MLNTLMKNGAYRIDHFENKAGSEEQAFGFYVRGEPAGADAYSRDAKSQLYAGLMLIHTRLGMKNLRGIYIDVDRADNLQRPAYAQLKADLISGLFKTVFTLGENALLGSEVAKADMRRVHQLCGGFELLVCKDGVCTAVQFI